LAKKSTRKAAQKKTTKKGAKRRVKPVARKTSAKKGVRKPAAKASRAPRASSVRKRTVRSRATTSRAAKAGARTPSKPATGRRKTSRAAASPAETAPPIVADAVAAAKPARALRRAECEPFRRLLLEKRAQLVGDVNTLQDEALSRNRQDAAGDLSNMPIHMADLGTDNYEQEFTLGLIEGERRVLQEIDEALERIERGTYGICLATGKAISKARLRAHPWAKYCYEYMLAQEKGQKGRF
jgi:RNA polymerase-binding protein DksA